MTATGSLPLLYQWFRDTPTNAIAGATNASHVIGSVREEDAGVYWVAVSNAFGTVLSDATLLTVQMVTNQAVRRHPLVSQSKAVAVVSP